MRERERNGRGREKWEREWERERATERACERRRYKFIYGSKNTGERGRKDLKKRDV